ncbi:MAG TPA: hypothetical protein VK996_11900 [Ramlibacter sp.]|nr:hypothetical protein [Ramlibacter sp.]
MKQLSTGWAARVLVACSCLLASACAPLHHETLASSKQKQLREIDIQLVIPQETFIFSVPITGLQPSAGGVGGAAMLSALIAIGNSATQTRDQERLRPQMRPILDSVIDTDLREEAANAVRAAAHRFPFKIRTVAVANRIPSDAEMDAMIARTKGGTPFIQLFVHYSVDLKSSTLTTGTHIGMWQDGVMRRSYGGSAVFQGRFASGLPGVRTNSELPDLLNQAMQETLRMVALDMQRPAGEPSLTMEHEASVWVNGIAKPFKAKRIDGDGRRPLLRDQKGVLYSLQE